MENARQHLVPLDQGDIDLVRQEITVSCPEVVRIVGALTDEHIRTIIDYFISRPHLVPQNVRMYFMRDLLVQDYNATIVGVAEEFRELQEQNPAVSVVARIIVDGWLMAHDLQAIESAKVNQHISAHRKARAESFIRKWMRQFAMPETVLVEESLDLAAKVQALRLQKQQLEAEVAEKQKQTIAVVSEAQDRALTLIRDAQLKVDALHGEETATEKRIQRVRGDLQKLESLKEKLLQEPELQEAYKQDADSEVEKLLVEWRPAILGLSSYGSRGSIAGMRSGAIDCLQVMYELLETVEVLEAHSPEFRGKFLSSLLEIFPEFRISIYCLSDRSCSATPRSCQLRKCWATYFSSSGLQQIVRCLLTKDTSVKKAKIFLGQLIQKIQNTTYPSCVCSQSEFKSHDFWLIPSDLK